MQLHDEQRMQLLFTTHESSIMDRAIFRRDEIWFVERNAENASSINPKKNSAIGELAKNIEIAIEQEKKINSKI